VRGTPAQPRMREILMTERELRFRTRLLEWLSCPIPNDTFKPRFVKEALVSLRGERCEQCGSEPVQLEHRDGNFTNNTPENVALLCPTCHSKTPTYAGRNRGHGRKTRTERDQKLKYLIRVAAAKTGRQLGSEMQILVHNQPDSPPKRIVRLRRPL
jgi:hypothetical protein